ncbi:hypothetical protein [Inquilinus sp. OTU3971]|uniref:hypothetical protein n=1 Tax=Inquilinus sp. OTU3971 TaxID=3043855 RepID=UPI00313DB0CB
MNRSKAVEKEAARKSREHKVHKFGPGELSRISSQSNWTMAHPGRAKENPHRREKVYSPEDLARGEKFEAWCKTHPNRDYSDNPYSWDKAHPSKPKPKLSLF